MYNSMDNPANLCEVTSFRTDAAEGLVHPTPNLLGMAQIIVARAAYVVNAFTTHRFKFVPDVR